MTYCSLETIRKSVPVSVIDDTRVLSILDTTDELIDKQCNQSFADESDSTKTFNVKCKKKLCIPNLRAFTEITLDDVVLTEDQYSLQPDGGDYQWIILYSYGDELVIEGTWGFADVPSLVETAAQFIALRLIRELLDGDIYNISLGGNSVSYSLKDESTSLTKTERCLLMKVTRSWQV